MKIILYAVAAVAASIAHSFVNENEGPITPESRSDSAQSCTSSIFSISSDPKNESSFSFISPTEANVNYQAYYSYDQTTWHKHGMPYVGNGDLHTVTIASHEADAHDQLFLKFKTN